MAEILRPPIVTILGHVDHGKTTLLDFIRKANVAAKEAGGITQHIGAYQTEHQGKLITFIDTPGHAAFEKMRSRGAKVADIAVLVVALDDGVMPQTVEAIKHILGAKVPIIVAVNKIDLPGLNLQVQLEKVKRQLADNQVLIEEYGGDVPLVSLSAKTGEGVDKLLEMILLVAELHEFAGDPDLSAQAVVIESSLDKSKGPIATLLVRNGSLKKGEQIMLGGVKGKVRGMIDYAGKSIETAGPSTPIEVLGLESVPQVGAVLGEPVRVGVPKKEVNSLINKLREDKSQVLNVVIKADKQGSLEAIIDALLGFNQDGDKLKIVSAATGDITESDIKIASATRSIVVGFNTKVLGVAQKLAETEHVLVRTYSIIYELLDEMKDVIEGMAAGELNEEIFGTAQIVAEFPYGKNERIAGCKVVEGTVSKGPKIRIVRDGEIIAETKIKSMKKAREEVGKAAKGEECGLILDQLVDFRVGDVIQSFRTL